jgi:hypothetical protein
VAPRFGWADRCEANQRSNREATMNEDSTKELGQVIRIGDERVQTTCGELCAAALRR